MKNLRTPAWRLVGLTRNEPGVLTLQGGRLTYRGRGGSAFDVPLAEVSGVVFPWYYFGGGVKLTAAGEAYRFSFVRPNGAPVVADGGVSLEHRGGGAEWRSEPTLDDVARGRRAGKAWKSVLGAWPLADGAAP